MTGEKGRVFQKKEGGTRRHATNYTGRLLDSSAQRLSPKKKKQKKEKKEEGLGGGENTTKK